MTGMPLSIRLPAGRLEDLQARAEADGIGVSTVARGIIERALQDEGFMRLVIADLAAASNRKPLRIPPAVSAALIESGLLDMPPGELIAAIAAARGGR